MDPNGPLRLHLDNGLVIILQEQDTKSTSFGIGARFGSIHHPAAHFLEHLLFKGTKTKTPADINRKGAMRGGSLDAFTDFFSTFYVTKNPSNYAHEALELLCDMLSNSAMTETELEHERAVLIEELREDSEKPELMLLDAVYRNLYEENPVRTAVLDDERLLRTISRAELQKIYRKFYAPQNLIVVGVGQIDKKAVLETIKRYFASRRSQPLKPFAVPDEKPLKWSKRIHIPYPTQRIHLMVGFRAVPCSHPDFYPLRVLSAVLGENINSRLFEETRSKRGLVYNIASRCDTMRVLWQSKLKADCSAWHGILRIYSRFSQRNLKRVQEVIRKELQRLTTEEVSSNELKVNQQKLVGERELDLVGTFRYMHILFTAEVNNTLSEVANFEQKILAVTSGDITRVARQHCSPCNAVWAVLRPKSYN